MTTLESIPMRYLFMLPLLLPAAIALAEEAPSQALPPATQAQALFAKGEYAAALQAIDQALLANPRDPALWALKGDIASADHNRPLALTAYREADRLDPRDRVADRLGVDDRPTQAWRIEAGGSRESFSAQRDLEAAGYAQLAYAAPGDDEGGSRWTAQLGSEVQRRYDATDFTVLGEASYRYAPKLRAIARGGYTPQADFTYDWTAGGGLELKPCREFAAVVDVDHRAYRTSETTQLRIAPGVRLSWHMLAAEVRYRATVDHAPGTTEHGGVVYGQVAITVGPLKPYVGYLQGRESDLPQPIADVTTWSGGLDLALDENLTLRASAAYEQRKDIYNRTTVGGSLIYRF